MIILIVFELDATVHDQQIYEEVRAYLSDHDMLTSLKLRSIQAYRDRQPAELPFNTVVGKSPSDIPNARGLSNKIRKILKNGGYVVTHLLIMNAPTWRSIAFMDLANRFPDA